MPLATIQAQVACRTCFLLLCVPSMLHLFFSNLHIPLMLFDMFQWAVSATRVLGLAAVGQRHEQ